MTGEPDLAPYQIIIYNEPFDDPEEAARIDITGQVTGKRSYVEEFQNRLNDERDPFNIVYEALRHECTILVLIIILTLVSVSLLSC